MWMRGALRIKPSFMEWFHCITMSKGRSESREELLQKMLSLIRKNPGIRPRELHQLLHLEHSWGLRSTLIMRGLVRKRRDGPAVRYYPVRGTFSTRASPG